MTILYVIKRELSVPLSSLPGASSPVQRQRDLPDSSRSRWEPTVQINNINRETIKSLHRLHLQGNESSNGGVARMVQLHKQEFVNVPRKGLSTQNLAVSQNYHLV